MIYPTESETMTDPLTPERASELAVLVGQKRVAQALRLTMPASVAMVLNSIDDVGALNEDQFSAACDQVAELVPDLRVTITSTPAAVLLTTGDRVRLVQAVGYLAAGCEGTVIAIHATGLGQQTSAVILVDGFGSTNTPCSALERIGTVATPHKEN